MLHSTEIFRVTQEAGCFLGYILPIEIIATAHSHGSVFFSFARLFVSSLAMARFEVCP